MFRGFCCCETPSKGCVTQISTATRMWGSACTRGDDAQTNHVTSALPVATSSNMAKKGKGAQRVSGKTSGTSAAPVSTPQRWTGPCCRPFQGCTGNTVVLTNGSTSVSHVHQVPTTVMHYTRLSSHCLPLSCQTGSQSESLVQPQLPVFHLWHQTPKQQTHVFLLFLLFGAACL